MSADCPGGIAHRSMGRPPNNSLPENTRQEILDYATGPAKGASCAHLADLLDEFQHIKVSAKTIGRILKSTGIENLHSHKAPRRFRRRPRMPQEGLMNVLDASPHDWIEGRGPEMTLHGGIDDATGKVTGLYFRPNEDLAGYLQVFDQTIRKYGVFHTAYTDRHTIFISPQNDKLTVEQQLAGETAPLTQFGMALRDLEIKHIRARTPQAKGRIERLWETLQERLIIEMRLAGIANIDDANAFLPHFIEKHNQRFAVEAANPEIAYRPKPHSALLKRILSYREPRRPDRGSVISYAGETYQLWPSGANRPAAFAPGAIVWVHTHLDGTRSAVLGDKHYQMRPFEKPVAAAPDPRPAKPPKKPWSPPSDHPWKKDAKRAFEAKERRLAQK